VYVAGATGSNLPTTAGAFDESFNGAEDAFISKLSGDLTQLLASTYLGGGDSDWANALALDSAGNVYVAGYTHSSDFPTTAGAFDESFNGGWEDAFISKLDANLSAIANQPPQTSLTADPTSGYAPLTVLFFCQATDPDGYVTEYRWDFDGDGQIDMTTTYYDYATSYTYQTAGTYQATCMAVDDQGAVASASVTIEVEEAANQPPQITSFTAYPTSGHAPLTITFTCQATDPDGYITEYRWDFDGDGQIDMITQQNITDGSSVIYTYQTAGTYQATCTVVDDQGAVASASVTIEVEENVPINAAPATPMPPHTLTNPARQPADVIVLSGAQKEQVIVVPSLVVPEDRRGQKVNLYWGYCMADRSWCSELYSLGRVLLSEDTVSFPIITTPQDFSYLVGDFLIYVGFTSRNDLFLLDMVYNYYEVRFEAIHRDAYQGASGRLFEKMTNKD
jgi:PKD repeat protein